MPAGDVRLSSSRELDVGQGAPVCREEAAPLLGIGEAGVEIGTAPSGAEQVGGVDIGLARDRDDLEPAVTDDTAHQTGTRACRLPHCPGDPVDVIAAPVDAFPSEFIPVAGASATLGSLPHR